MALFISPGVVLNLIETIQMIYWAIDKQKIYHFEIDTL